MTLRRIRLYGQLGRRFGRVHSLAVGSVAEAIRAMCMVLPGFERELMTSRDRGVCYAIFLGKRNISESELALPPGGEDIRIAPILTGAKQGGIFQVVFGAALIGLALWNPAFLGLGQAGLWSVGTIGGMGISMALGGVISLFAPQPAGLSSKDSVDNGASYTMNGAVNTAAQGNCVPVAFGGPMWVGSAAISGGMYAEDQQ